MTARRCGFVCVSIIVILAFALRCRLARMPVRPPDREPASVLPEDPAAPAIERVQLRILAKNRIVQDLISGRRSLVHAAALFRELDGTPPEARYPAVPDPDPPLRLSSPTEGDRHCITVITFVRNLLRATRPDRPDRAEAVTGRLVAEFWAERERGAIRLPEAASLESVDELLQRARDDLDRVRLGS